jgi:hypothetical protein
VSVSARADVALRGLVVLLFAVPAAAQTDIQDAPRVTPLLENLTRAEIWSFFTPPPSGGDSDYAILGNRATLGARVDGRRIAFQGSFRYAQLLGLPRDAVGPGPLGPGALYFAAARTPEAYQLYFRSVSLQIKNVVPGVSVEGGRIAYESGEGTAFAGRLIGTAEWTVFERAFDGIRIDYRQPAWRAHFSFLMPTQGAFEESANPTMGRLQLTTASWSFRGLQLFAHNYRDTRGVRGRPDNTGFAAPAADVHVQTFGASLAQTYRRTELRGWAALQRGRWFDDRHRAYSFIIEARHQWGNKWRPALEAGFTHASGDDNAGDDRHGTFFPMIPTTAPGRFAGTYAQMNLRDLFVRVRLEPRPLLAIDVAVHRLSLANAFDRWYSGTGATALRGEYFGYSSRPSRLSTGLGTALDASVEAAVHPLWTLTAAIGAIDGGEVVSRQFSGHWATVLVVQSRFKLGTK